MRAIQLVRGFLLTLFAFSTFALSANLSANEGVFRVSINGGPLKPGEHLAAFHRQLLEQLKTTDLAKRDIGCIGCDEVGEVDGPTEVTYLVSRSDEAALNSFSKAWLAVQSTMPSPLFKLSLDAEAPPAATCEGYKPPCFYRPNCGGTGKCSKVSNACVQCSF